MSRLPKTMMEKVRTTVFTAIRRERERQVEQFPLQADIQQVETDLLDTVGVLTAYLGKVADQGLEQRAGRPVDPAEVGRNFTVVAAVSAAMVEALVARGLVKPSDLAGRD